MELSWGSKPTEAGVRCPAPRHQSTVNKIFQSTGAEYFPESLPPSIGARTSPIGIGHWPHGALLSLEITAGTDRVNCLRNIGAKTGILKFTFLRQQDRQLLARMRTVLMCLSERYDQIYKHWMSFSSASSQTINRRVICCPYRNILPLQPKNQPYYSILSTLLVIFLKIGK